MNYEERLTQRIDKLIEMGAGVLATKHQPRTGFNFVDGSLFYEWKTASLSFLNAVLGPESIHFKEFEQGCKHTRHSVAVVGQAVLKAAKTDFEGGHLKKLEDLVSADIFSDFLEMAQYLLEQGYKDPAASLAGAVLEDGLRRIARSHTITVKSKEDISSLNKKLADGQVYNRLVQRQVEVWNELRNNADHGHFAEYDPQQVKDMLTGIRSFLTQHL